MKVEELTCEVVIVSPRRSTADDLMNDAYFLLKDMESFPAYMENVTSVSAKPVSENSSIIEWNCIIEGAQFNWIQKTVFNQLERQISFELIEGDFEIFEGYWKVLERNNEIFLQIIMKYSIGLPVIEEVLGPILRSKLENNSNSMLTSIKNKVEEKHGK